MKWDLPVRPTVMGVVLTPLFPLGCRELLLCPYLIPRILAIWRARLYLNCCYSQRVIFWPKDCPGLLPCWASLQLLSDLKRSLNIVFFRSLNSLVHIFEKQLLKGEYSLVVRAQTCTLSPLQPKGTVSPWVSCFISLVPPQHVSGWSMRRSSEGRLWYVLRTCIFVHLVI